MKRLIRKILREHKSDKHYRRLDIISDHVQLPYFESMEGLTIYDEDDQEYIMRKILGNIYIGEQNNWKTILDYRDNEIYDENPNGFWMKHEYDDKGNEIYRENSDGWVKTEYNDNGNEIYSEDSDGYWVKYEYDNNDNKIYRENSHGYWEKWGYDNNGYEISYKDSDGDIIDYR